MLAAAGNMWFWLLRTEVLVPLAGCLVGIVAILAHAWHSVETHKADVELKHDMVARGMSAEDIERVLRAKSTDKSVK